MKGKLIKAYAERESRENVLQFALRILGLDGGPGSGNFGHAGRPGKVGGSQKESGGSAFRSGNKETGYTSFAKTQAFKGIVTSARNSKSYHEFVKNMSQGQKDALRVQHAECGTQENMAAYAKRVYMMLHGRGAVSQILQKNKPVDGKDITRTWKYQGGEMDRYGNSTEGTKAIDTEIEDVIHQQGFDGVPKIVTKQEFDKITKENPQMPILFRSYAADGSEQLRSYDEDLEKGFFYVDCGTGGAGFGQGMYTAGVYGPEKRKWDDPEFYLHPKRSMVIEDDRGRLFEVQRSYTTNNDVLSDPSEGDKYIFTRENDDGSIERKMLQAVDLGDEFGIVWQDMNTHEFYKGNVRNDFDEFSDIDEVTPAFLENEKKKALSGAKTEMDHYRALNMNRIRENAPPVIPEGMETIAYNGIHYYYDPSYEQKFSDGKPFIARNLVCVKSPDNPNDKYIWRVSDDGKSLISLDERHTMSLEDLSDSDSEYKWSYCLGRCETKKVDPMATTRQMTLDPSAKIITYDQVEDEFRKRKDQVFADEIRKETDKYLDDQGIKNKAISDILFYRCHGGNTFRKADEMEANLSEEDRKIWEKVEDGISIDQIKEIKRRASEQTSRLPSDVGVMAAMMGYDAINAEGHGQTGSYTVVLNRTKVILCDEPFM